MPFILSLFHEHIYSSQRICTNMQQPQKYGSFAFICKNKQKMAKKNAIYMRQAWNPQPCKPGHGVGTKEASRAAACSAVPGRLRSRVARARWVKAGHRRRPPEPGRDSESGSDEWNLNRARPQPGRWRPGRLRQVIVTVKPCKANNAWPTWKPSKASRRRGESAVLGLRRLRGESCRVEPHGALQGE